MKRHVTSVLITIAVAPLLMRASWGDEIPKTLLQGLELREAAVHRLHYTSVTTSFTLPNVTRNPDESDTAFLARCDSLTPVLGSFQIPMVVSRDFDTASLHLRFGTMDRRGPLLEEYLENGPTRMRFKGAKNAVIHATIGDDMPPMFRDSTEDAPRMDMLAFRPIADHPTSTILKKAAADGFDKTLLNPWNTPSIVITASDTEPDTTSWLVTLRHREPKTDPRSGTRVHDILRRRIHFITIGDEVVIARIDELDVLPGRENHVQLTTLLEDYRPVEGVLIPHRQRYLRQLAHEVRGTITDITEVSINDSVAIPRELEIPPGTPVTNLLTNRKYRTGTSGEMQDARIASTLTELQRTVTFSKNGGFRYWLLIVNGVLVLAIAIVYFRNRKAGHK